MSARLGAVLYLAGIIGAVLIVVVGLWAVAEGAHGGLGFLLLIFGVPAAGAFLFGRAARYVLSGR